MWRLLVVTGCRRGEAVGVLWSDIDLDAGVWTVTRSISVDSAGRRFETTPKNGRKRIVRLDAGTVAALRAHRAAQAAEKLAWGAAYEDQEYVFCHENGAPLHPNPITRRFVLLTERARLPRIRLHDVRHTAVTTMLRAGIDVKVVSERVGHASTSFTRDAYQTVLPDQQMDAATRMAEAIGG